MEKKIFMIAAVILATGMILAGCLPAQVSGPAAADTPAASVTPAASNTPAPSATPSPTPTLTPTPVSFTGAVGQGSLVELESFGKGRIRARDFSPDGALFAAATIHGVHIFNDLTWEEISFIPTMPGVDIRFVRFSRDDSLLAGGDSIGNVTFWDTKTWEERRVINVGKGPITSLDISPDNKNCVTISDEKVVILWDLESGEQIKSMTRTKETWAVRYSHDGTWVMLLEPGGYRDLTTWKAGDLTFMNRLHELGRRAPDQAFSPFSDVVASYMFGKLNIHNFDNNEDLEFKDIYGFFDRIQLVFINEFTLFVKSNFSDSYRLYDIRTGTMREESMDQLPKLKNNNRDLWNISKADTIESLGFAPYGSIVAVSPQGDRLILRDGIFDLTEKALKKPLLVSDNKLWSNARVLDSGLVGVLNPWSANFPKKLKKDTLIIFFDDFEEMEIVDKKYIAYDLPDGIYTAALSPDGSVVAAGLSDGSVYYWDVNTGEQIGNFRAHAKVPIGFGLFGGVRNLAFDQNGTHIFTIGADGFIKVWSLGEKTPILNISGKTAVFTPDGKKLIYLDGLNRIQIVSLYDKDPQVTLKGENKDITALAFSEDGSMLISGQKDSIRVWSLVEQQLLMEIPLNGTVGSLAMSPDGTCLYVSTHDGVISVWGYGAP